MSRAPRSLAGYILAIDAVALVWGVGEVARMRPSWHECGVLVLLMGLALVFEEGARRAARLQLRLSADLKRDMTSVWAVAAAVALRPGPAVILLVAVLTYVWFRQHRQAGEALYRKVFNAATAVLGCLGAGLLLHAGKHQWVGLPFLLSGTMAVVIAIVGYTVINRMLVTGALLLMGARGRALIGTYDDNLIELATLCLGGLVALAALYEPWLTVLVIAPMYTLQRGALVRELETAASTDSKTGLLNAVAWEQLAKRELARGEREGYPVAVLIIDIDRFKLVNDRFGHLVGDAVLRGIGRTLDAAIREYDTVGRFGGEEFVAVLPEADDISALMVAERVRSRVNRMRVCDFVEGLDPALDDLLAVSVGVSCTPLDGVELSELLHAADQALYRAKESGRNQVQLAYRGGGEAPVRGAVGPVDR